MLSVSSQYRHNVPSIVQHSNLHAWLSKKSMGAWIEQPCECWHLCDVLFKTELIIKHASTTVHDYMILICGNVTTRRAQIRWQGGLRQDEPATFMHAHATPTSWLLCTSDPKQNKNCRVDICGGRFLFSNSENSRDDVQAIIWLCSRHGGFEYVLISEWAM
jgi:hypothetical protein